MDLSILKKYLEDNENVYNILNKKIKRDDSESNEKEIKKEKITKNINPKNEIKVKKSRKIKFKDLSDSSDEDRERIKSKMYQNDKYAQIFQNTLREGKDICYQIEVIFRLIKYNLNIFIKLITFNIFNFNFNFEIIFNLFNL